MAENFYRTRKYNVDHTTFGGYITEHDFNGHTSMSDIAKRIASDWKFDKYCANSKKFRFGNNG